MNLASLNLVLRSVKVLGPDKIFTFKKISGQNNLVLVQYLNIALMHSHPPTPCQVLPPSKVLLNDSKANKIADQRQ